VFSLLCIPFDKINYLDLGANHAKYLSNTFYFYRMGARGVLVEANPALIPELKLFRNQDIILNRCIAEKSGELVSFYVLSNNGLSTPSKEEADEFLKLNPELSIESTIDIETITVSEIMKRYFHDAPTLLNIDIEGMEESVLRSIDFDTCRPLVIVCEMIPYMPNHILAALKKNQTITEILNQNDYVEYAFTGVNSIFIDKKRLDSIKETQ
jgi:FkbM family methyltransferase